MDKNLLLAVRKSTPDINHRIANGLATEQLTHAERYIDQVFRGAANSFPEGLTYLGYRRCTPAEEFNEITRTRDSKQSYELARSDFYMVMYQFQYQGVDLYPRYLYLPYVDTGGILYVRGKRAAILPVLADAAFSVGMSSMFIQLTRTRITFERNITYHFMANDQREMIYVVWSWLHHGMKKTKKSVKVVRSSLAHYFFAKFGVIKTFSEFAGADIIIGGEEINRANYPNDKWIICSSVGLSPRSWSGKHYIGTKIRVAIPVNQYTPLAKSLLAGFFYVVDNFPEKVDPEHVDNTWVWKVMLGNILFAPGTSVGLMVREVEAHLEECDRYMDFIVKEELHRAGIDVDNTYELFAYVIEVLSQKTVQSDVGISSIYGKKLVTLRYVLHDIVTAINRMMYKLQGSAKNKGTLDEKAINSIMNKFLRLSTVADITKGQHGEVTHISTSNDCMFFGVTSAMVPQEDATTHGGSKSRINLRDPSKHLHVSVAELAGYNNLPKADPTGRRRINPCLQLDWDGTVIRDPDKRALLDRVQRMLTR